jgi:glutamyl/glutaminyl-tRNA synthetase
MSISADECRRRAEVMFELAWATEDAFERLGHVLRGLDFEARARVLEEEAKTRSLT